MVSIALCTSLIYAYSHNQEVSSLLVLCRLVFAAAVLWLCFSALSHPWHVFQVAAVVSNCCSFHTMTVRANKWKLVLLLLLPLLFLLLFIVFVVPPACCGTVWCTVLRSMVMFGCLQVFLFLLEMKRASWLLKDCLFYLKTHIGQGTQPGLSYVLVPCLQTKNCFKVSQCIDQSSLVIASLNPMTRCGRIKCPYKQSLVMSQVLGSFWRRPGCWSCYLSYFVICSCAFLVPFLELDCTSVGKGRKGSPVSC